MGNIGSQASCKLETTELQYVLKRDPQQPELWVKSSSDEFV